jgi:two-component system sensor histidine kinase CiaH
MIKFWKQSGESATGLKDRPFLWARLRLTAFYIVVVFFILAFASLSLYYSLAKNIKDNLEIDATTEAQQHFLANANHRLGLTILMIDLIVLIVTALLSYVLARRTLEPIKKALETQTQFTADASHEFRTPLAVVMYDSEVALRDPNLTLPEAREVLQSNFEELRHMAKIVERLLMLARNENGWNKIATAQIEFSGLVQDAVEKVIVLAKQKDLVIEIKSLEEGTVLGNRDSLHEMLLNILQNSIDYTNKGGKILVSLRKNLTNMDLKIEDTGIGISPEDLPHIYKRFYKSDQARSIKQGGGLGLSIVFDIIRNHHGTINVQSILAKGTTVLIQLPLV